MKTVRLFSKIAFSLGLIAGFIACEPMEMDKPDVDAAPQNGQVTFSVTPSDTSAYYYVLKNTSSITGIAYFTVNNGSRMTGQEVLMYTPLPGDYKVIMTLVTNGGIGSDSSITTTTVTDLDFLNNPINKMFSGGKEVAEGKTWVVDSLKPGHFTMGPNASDLTSWWSAGPLNKKGLNVYDDELTLKFNNFTAVLDNHGKSYTMGKFKDESYFSNPVGDGDATVNFTPATDNTWSYNPGDKSLTFSGSKPMVLGIFGKPVGDKYTLLSSDAHHFVLSFVDSKDHFGWTVSFIEKGYGVTYSVNFGPTAGVNEYALSLTNIKLPEGSPLNIVSYSVDFGDATDAVTTTDVNAVLNHTYMVAGTYNAVVTAKLTDGSSITAYQPANAAVIAANHPDYVPTAIPTFLLWNDFSEVQMYPLESDASATLAIVDNPAKFLPNRSSKVMHYSKSNQQWSNAYMKLPAARFDISTITKFSILVYGVAGQEVLLKLENTDMAEAWRTGTNDLKYVIKASDTWELAEFEFKGVGAASGSDSPTSDVTNSIYNKNFYNVVRIMLQPGNDSGNFDFYFDELRGPSVEGIKSLQIK